MPLSAELANKSVQAAVAAIEVYNKPNFHTAKRHLPSS